MARGGLLIIIILGVILLSTFLTSMVIVVEEGLGLNEDTARVAKIKLEGEIMQESIPSLFSAGTGLTSQKVKDDLERAEALKVDAIIFEINSPGGTVLATKEIGKEIKKVEIPKIAVVKEMAASGGYWAASTTDYIIADEMSIVGSIGVLGAHVEFSELMEKYGVGYERLVAGKYKDAGTPLRKMTDEEVSLFQDRLDIIHNEFKKEIMLNRGMTPEEIDAVSEGLFYLGTQSVENKLIDEIGDEETAKEKIKQILNVTEVKMIDIEKPTSIFESFAGVISKSFFKLGEGIGTGLNKIDIPQNTFEVYT